MLEEVRMAKGLEDLSDNSVAYLGRLRTSDSEAATLWEYALSPAHRVEQAGNEAYLRAHFERIVSVEARPASELKDDEKDALASELQKKVGVPFILSLAHDCKVVFRAHDQRKRYQIGDEGVVDMATDVDREAFKNRQYVKVLINATTVKVLPMVVEIQGQEDLKIFPLMLAYRQTIRMAQSRQKPRWPIILTQEFGGGQYDDLARGSLTFEYVQVHCAAEHVLLIMCVVTNAGRVCLCCQVRAISRGVRALSNPSLDSRHLLCDVVGSSPIFGTHLACRSTLRGLSSEGCGREDPGRKQQLLFFLFFLNFLRRRRRQRHPR